MNHNKSVFILLLVLSVFFLWLGQHFGERQGLLLSFIFTLIFNSYVYYFSDLRILSTFKVREIEGNDPWNLRSHLLQLTKKAHMPMPKIYLSEIPFATALSVGKSWTKAHIILSKELLNEFDQQDIQAVLALELAKIKRLDTLSLGMMSLLLSLAFQLLHLLDEVFSFRWLGLKNSLQPFTWICLPLMRFSLSLLTSPRIYFDADTMAAGWVGDPKIVAKAIWKLESYVQTHDKSIPIDMVHLFVVSPLRKDSFLSWLRIQPKYNERIKKLVGYFPI